MAYVPPSNQSNTLTESPMRRNATAWLLLPLIIATAPVGAADLLDTAERSGSFKTFLNAVQIAGLTRQLRVDGPYTVFMPTDNAFAQMSDADRLSLKKEPQALARLLRYHMVAGKLKITEVKPGASASVAGPSLNLKSDNGMVTVNGVRVTESDLQADNGIIHAIDEVLMPPDN